MGLYCDINELNNESDVEQKFIIKFLTMDFPLGLGFDSSEILTKANLRTVFIGKGQNKKVYYPDYIISIRGIPLFVLEAKKPGENLENAYSEARLYAAEINSRFEHNVNACRLILVSNGSETWAGYSDTDTPKLKLSFDDFNTENVKYSNLLDFCSRSVLESHANQPYVNKRGKAFFNSPVTYIGGKMVQNENIEQNAFGRSLIFENDKIFDPKSEDDRRAIISNAYVPSARREQHAEPIYKEIRKFETPSQKNAIPLATENPQELADRISERIGKRIDAYSLMLLIGNVGSGKTTFVRWFKWKYLGATHADIASKCDWIFMDMNHAPNSTDEIYGWVKNELLEGIKTLHSDIAFHSIEIQRHIFRNELREFEEGIGQLIKDDKVTYNHEIYELLKSKKNDNEAMLIAILDYLKGDYGIIPIVVLDNCDKRDRDTQLLMFEVGQWLRHKFNCIVIMPMRDRTYDLYKDEKPLDTVIKDLVFRIDSPDLLKVLQARLEYISRISTHDTREYTLQNGMKVIIGSDELVEYYKSIMLAIRQSEMIRNIFYRLSDKNTRKGIELFESFCKSGHISADEIFQIRATGGICKIPSYKFLNAILRKDRRYYNGDESNFINLFASNYNDDFPDPFVIVDILIWLNSNKNKIGPTGNRGMFRCNDVIHYMEIIGHKDTVVKREINYLVNKGLLYSETKLNEANENDLIMITIPGMLHLGMLSHVPYLAACAENVYFKTTSTTSRIADRLRFKTYLSKLTMVLNAKDLLDYLEMYRKEYVARPDIYIKEDEGNCIFNLEPCIDAVNRWIENDSHLKENVEKLSLYIPGCSVNVNIKKKKSNSLTCLINDVDGQKGFLSTLESKYNLDYQTYQTLNEKDNIKCEVLSFDYDHNSFQLKFIERI